MCVYSHSQIIKRRKCKDFEISKLAISKIVKDNKNSFEKAIHPIKKLRKKSSKNYGSKIKKIFCLKRKIASLVNISASTVNRVIKQNLVALKIYKVHILLP